MIYLHWPLDISLDALKRLPEVIGRYLDDVPYNHPKERIELENIANEARAMVQKASIGAIKVERRPAPIDDDELLG